ncbi:MAG: lipid II flippase MurJ, partial [Bryobacteraceae bacterium]
GAGDALDAFLAAFLVPSLLADTLAGPMGAALVPGFVGLKERSGGDAAEHMFQRTVAWTLSALGGAAVLLALGSPYAVELLGSGFNDAKRGLTQNLLLLLLPVLPLGGLSVAWRSRLNSEGRFAVAALAPAAVPVLTMAAIFAFGRSWGAYALAAGTLAGGILEVTLLGIGLKRRGHRILPRWAARTPEMDRVFRQYVPIMASTLLFGAALFIDQALAARLKPGSVSALNLGTKLVTVLLGVGAGGVGTAVLPHLSRYAAREDWLGLWRTVRTQGILMIGAATAGTLLLLAFSDAAVRTLFQSRAFTDEAAATVDLVQRAALLRVPFAVLLSMMMGLVSALQRNELVMRVALVSLVINAALDVLLIQGPLGVAGIPLAGSIAQAASALFLGALLYREIRARVSVSNSVP